MKLSFHNLENLTSNVEFSQHSMYPTLKTLIIAVQWTGTNENLIPIFFVERSLFRVN